MDIEKMLLNSIIKNEMIFFYGERRNIWLRFLSMHQRQD